MTTRTYPPQPHVNGFAALDSFIFEGTPPHDVPAEESVIGSLLIDGESLEKIHNDLSPQDFYTEKNRLCYKAALSIYESGGGINAVTIIHSLRATGDLESVGGAAYLGALVQAVPTSVFVVHYAAIMTRCAQQRALIHAVQNAADTILHPDLLPHRAAEQLSDMLMNAAPIPETETTDLRWQMAMDRLLVEANKSDGERLPTGFRDIDKALMDGIERKWCLDNPTRQKTLRGVPRFLNAWLSKEQNSGRRSRKPAQTAEEHLAEINAEEAAENQTP